MDENSRHLEGAELQVLQVQVGLSGRFVAVQGVMDSMTVLDIKHRARDEVAQLLGKEFLATDLMSLLHTDGVEALKNTLKMEELEAMGGPLLLRVIVDSTPLPEVFGALPGHGKDEEQRIVGRFMSLYFDIATKDDPVKEQLPNHEDFKFRFGLIRSLFSDVGKFVKTLQPENGSEQFPCKGTATVCLRSYCSGHRECYGKYNATKHPGNCMLSGISNSINPEDTRACTGFIKDSEQAKKLFQAIDCLSVEQMVDLKKAARMSTLLSTLAEELKTCHFVGDHVLHLRPWQAPYPKSVRCNGQRLDGQAEQRLAEFVQIFAGIKDLFGQ
eukprot:Skav217125  [mRNA]  locus=scaffold783:384583:386694:- [translate_table: standard]